MSYALRQHLNETASEAISELKDLFEGNDWAQNYIEKHKFRCADDVDNVSRIAPDSKVLNIGGAPYIFETLAVRQGLEVTSVDLDPNRHIKVIERMGFSVTGADIEDSDQRDELDIGDFDVIVLAEVFEHMRMDLIGTLAFIHDSMKPDAALYLTTPNFFFFRRFVKRMRKGRSGPSVVSAWSKLTRLGHMGHVREYSVTELVELFEHVGFTVAGVKFRNRSSGLRKSVKGFFQTVLPTIMERSFDRFAQEIVFTLRK